MRLAQDPLSREELAHILDMLDKARPPEERQAFHNAVRARIEAKLRSAVNRSAITFDCPDGRDHSSHSWASPRGARFRCRGVPPVPSESLHVAGIVAKLVPTGRTGVCELRPQGAPHCEGSLWELVLTTKRGGDERDRVPCCTEHGSATAREINGRPEEQS